MTAAAASGCDAIEADWATGAAAAGAAFLFSSAAALLAAMSEAVRTTGVARDCAAASSVTVASAGVAVTSGVAVSVTTLGTAEEASPVDIAVCLPAAAVTVMAAEEGVVIDRLR